MPPLPPLLDAHDYTWAHSMVIAFYYLCSLSCSTLLAFSRFSIPSRFLCASVSTLTLRSRSIQSESMACSSHWTPLKIDSSGLPFCLDVAEQQTYSGRKTNLRFSHEWLLKQPGIMGVFSKGDSGFKPPKWIHSCYKTYKCTKICQKSMETPKSKTPLNVLLATSSAGRMKV